MLLIGSAAMETVLDNAERSHHFRSPKDFDFICTIDEMKAYVEYNRLQIKPLSEYKAAGLNMQGKLIAEFELLHESKSGQAYVESFHQPVRTVFIHTNDKSIAIHTASAPILYSIKKSHRHYPRNWKKHIDDLMILHELVDGIDVMPEITKLREQETEIRNGRLRTPRLNKTKDEFFNDNVSNRTFVHDDIHAVMAHRAKPMYSYYKKNDDPNSVACSKEKFFELPYLDQMRGVQEEAYVIALERCIIPMIFAKEKIFSSREAFDYAIMRICTTLTSGWFREFATMNYRDIYDSANPKYVEKFLTAFEEGRIAKIA